MKENISFLDIMTFPLWVTTLPHEWPIFAPKIVCNCSRVGPPRSVKESHSQPVVTLMQRGDVTHLAALRQQTLLIGCRDDLGDGAG